MHLTLQTQLLPDQPTAAKLRVTVERFNEAASWLAGIAFERKLANKFLLQKLCYVELRERFGLPADTAIRCISQVCEAYRRDKTIQPTFRPLAAVPFSMGKNIGFKDPDRVSISTLVGRVIVPFLMGKYQAERFGWSKGQCDLVLRKDGKWFLLVTVDVPEGTPIPATDCIGVDMGVVNLATTDEGKNFSGDETEKVRKRYQRLRKTCQRTGTKSTKRKLQTVSKKETRFRKDANHCIAKKVVAQAKDTGRGIAVEDLGGINGRTPVRKPERNRRFGWAFAQLRLFITYKAALAGVTVEAVDPRATSRTCSVCGHCEKGNRKTRDDFECKHCGFTLPADWNAAKNIRAKRCKTGPLSGGLLSALMTLGSNPSRDD